MDAGPVAGRHHEAFFAALAQDVLQAGLLGFGLVGDRDRPVAAIPDGAAPIVEPTDLFREISFQVLHEARHLLHRVGGQNRVKVVVQNSDGVEAHRVELLGSSQHADEGPAQSAARREQRAALERPAGDLYGCACPG